MEMQDEKIVSKLALLSNNCLQMDTICVTVSVGLVDRINNRSAHLSQKLMHLHVMGCAEEQQSRRRRGLKRMCGVSDGFLVSAGALS